MASRAWNKTGSFHLISCPQVSCPQAKLLFLNPNVPEDDEGPSCLPSPCTAPPWLGFFLSLKTPSTLRLVGSHLIVEHTSWGDGADGAVRGCGCGPGADGVVRGRRCHPGVDSSVRKRKRKTRFSISGSLQFKPKSMPRWCQHQKSQSCFENAGCVSDTWELWTTPVPGRLEPRASEIQTGAPMLVFVNTLCDLSMAGRSRHLQHGDSCKPSQRTDNRTGSLGISTEPWDLRYSGGLCILHYFQADFLKVAPR